MKKRVALLLLPVLSLLFAGCVSTTLTNLTASQQVRNPNNQYLVEYEWDSNQQTLRPESIKPQVVVGFDTYDMRRVLHMADRWEAWVPVPANKNSLTYHIKVDYEYNQFGKRGKGSIKTPEHRLAIVEK